MFLMQQEAWWVLTQGHIWELKVVLEALLTHAGESSESTRVTYVQVPCDDPQVWILEVQSRLSDLNVCHTAVVPMVTRKHMGNRAKTQPFENEDDGVVNYRGVLRVDLLELLLSLAAGTTI